MLGIMAKITAGLMALGLSGGMNATNDANHAEVIKNIEQTTAKYVQRMEKESEENGTYLVWTKQKGDVTYDNGEYEIVYEVRYVETKTGKLTKWDIFYTYEGNKMIDCGSTEPESL